jgi:DNA-binding NtrC family response regulator
MVLAPPRVRPDDRETPLSLIGDSPAVRTLRVELEAAVASACMLIEAEEGLDPADIAYEVHARDPRGGSFVSVDCAAAGPASIEDDLFGPAPSTVGDLECVRAGSALARAAGGTLLLLSVLELSASAQGRLARVVRDGEVLMNDTVRRLDVRLIASADSDAELADGRLRRDLLRHVARTRLTLAPLRRRTEDLPALVEHLVALGCVDEGRSATRVSAPAMTLLAALPWHGNLTELREAVTRMLRTVAGDVIELEDVLAHVRGGLLVPNAPIGTLRKARADFERDYITLVLRHHGWRIGDAARTLGIQRTNLYRKARQLGLTVTRRGGRA